MLPAMMLLTRTLQHLADRPLLALTALAVVAIAVGATGTLDTPVLAHLGNNPGNQGRA
jgi:hypothetical protein